MEQFNDTPVVNGVAYPTVTLDPTSYRLRFLNAANDRFFNFQWYVADPDAGDGTTEVKLNPDELKAAQTDPNVFPTPVQGAATAGPDWVQIANEGGFLPSPAVIDGQQPTTWITDPTRFDVGNVDQHSLLIAPAERADVIVDFAKFAGKTLILYNDAPAAFPARVASYDYYTGAPDLSPVGAPKILPGYGPNTRTIMRVKIADTAPAAAFDLAKLTSAFKHTINGTGVFESGQHPIVVGQAAYNSTYGSSFAASGNCSVGSGQKCDGFVRINDTSTFRFNTLRQQSSRVTMRLEPKAIHDEMNSSTFDEYGRMQANLGIEAQPPSPGNQNVTLYPYVNPQTELIDGTNLPKDNLSVTPISNTADGTQLWRITHNGVDTHPIHFHLYDVQVINRVTWDNIIIPPDKNELGWKDTVRVSPLEDTIVALRPVIPKLPFEVPNSVRPLNPMMDNGSTAMFNNVDIQGNPTNPIVNRLVNFGWEYVYHCHILSHEEMDMMRPVSLAVPPLTPDAVSAARQNDGTIKVTWNDNSITETGWVIQRSSDGTAWADLGRIDVPIDQPNTHSAPGSPLTYTDTTGDATTAYFYRIVAENTVGYGGQFPSLTATSTSLPYQIGQPIAPTNLVAAPVVPADPAPGVILTWTNNDPAATGIVVERSSDGGTTWTTLTDPLLAPTTVTYTDATAVPGVTYSYRVGAANGVAVGYSNTATITLLVGPSNLTLSLIATGVRLAWRDNTTTETAFLVERSVDNGTTWTQVTSSVAPAPGSGATVRYTDTSPPTNALVTYRVAATDGVQTAYSAPATITLSAPPTGLAITADAGPALNLAWVDNATNETGYTVDRSTDGGTTWTNLTSTLPAEATSYADVALVRGTTYTYRVGAVNPSTTAWSAPASHTVITAPASLTASSPDGTTVKLTWPDAVAEKSYVVERSEDNGVTWAQVGTAPANATSATDTTAQPEVDYSYRVGSVDGGDVAYSPTAGVGLTKAPTGLTATPLANAGVRLTWTDATRLETGYVVQRSDDNGATWTQVGATLPANATSVTDGGLTRGASYQYRVGATNAIGTAFSSPLTYLVVATPTNLVVTILGGPKAELTWTDNAVNETGYVVERSTDGTNWTRLTSSLAPGTVTYTNSPISAPATYYYRVGAANGADIAFSSAVKIVSIAAPTNLRASLRANPTRVRLTWTDRAVNETGFAVERSGDGGATWTQIGTVRAYGGTGSAVSYEDRTVTLGATYQYRVKVLNASAFAYSNTVSVTVGIPVAPPVTSGTAVATSSTRERWTLRWADLDSETAYTVQWSTNGTTVSGSSTLGANATSHARSDTRRTWYVRVRGTNALGNGAWSSWTLIARP